MKKTILLVILTISMSTFGQKMISRNGEIKFDATVPGAIDNVNAIDKTASAVFDKATGELVVQSLVKSFKFKSPLMQEHFNENYMESDKYPKATFKGKVLKYDQKSGSYEVEGNLTIHGETKKVNTKVSIDNSDKKVTISGVFAVKLKDYKLEVPALAKKTLSENAKVSFSLELSAK